MALRRLVIRHFSQTSGFHQEPATEEIYKIAKKCGIIFGRNDSAQPIPPHPYRSLPPVPVSDTLQCALERRLDRARNRLERLDSLLPFAAIGSGALITALSGSLLFSALSVVTYSALHLFLRSKAKNSAEESFYHDSAAVSCSARLFEVS